METSTLSDVQEYYGKTLSSSCDLKTNACTTSKRKLTPFLKETLGMIHDDVVTKYAFSIQAVCGDGAPL